MVRHDHYRNVWLGAAAFWLSVISATNAQVTPERGIELIRDSTKGNCSICHLIPGIGVPEDAQGNIGPSLAGVGLRLSPQELRERIVDARRFNPDTLMPPFGVTSGLVNVDHRYQGKPILTDAEITAVLSYLSGLK